MPRGAIMMCVYCIRLHREDGEREKELIILGVHPRCDHFARKKDTEGRMVGRLELLFLEYFQL
eukprot:scaffold824_cov151-Skeletonema_menzelii.AAC.6